MEWTVFGPVPQDRQEEVRNNLLAGKSPVGLSSIQTRGGNLYFRTRAGAEGLFSKTKPGNTVWAETTFHSPVEGTMHAMVGFDAPARSSRRCSGVPAAGEWSQCGTRIWVNGKEMKNPQTYKLAGQRRYEKHTWNSPANEIPFDNEEFWWARPPVPFQVKAGENKILIEQPYTGEFQSWGVSFIPVKKRETAGLPTQAIMPNPGERNRMTSLRCHQSKRQGTLPAELPVHCSKGHFPPLIRTREQGKQRLRNT